MSNIFDPYNYLVEAATKVGEYELAISDMPSLESNAHNLQYRDKELFTKFVAAGYVTPKGKLTPEGKTLAKKERKIVQDNMHQHLRKVFVLFSKPKKEKGVVWYDQDDKRQMDILTQPFVDTKFEGRTNKELTAAAYKGVSEFGQAIIAGQLHFYKIEEK
jgi:hypothetical protein